MIGSSPLISFCSMTPTRQLFSIAPLVVAPLSDIFFAPSSLALSCSLQVLQDLRFDHLPILLPFPFLWSFAQTNGHLPLVFRKLVGMNMFLLPLSLSFCRGILVFFSFLCCCSLYFSGIECSQIFHSFRQRQTLVSSLVICRSGRSD